MNTFSIEAAFRFAWDTFKKRPLFFIGITLIVFVVSWITGLVIGVLGLDKNPIGGLLNFAITTLVDLGIIATMLKVYESVESATYSDLWHPQQYLPYLGATALMGIIIIVGLILLIIPGIIAAAMLLFVKFLVVDRNLGPIEALKESARITEGHRVTLVLFILAIVAMNVAGAILLLLPLLITIPLSSLAMVYAYRTIGHQASEIVPATTDTPTPGATA